MKKLILVRHGSYNRLTDRLDDIGRREISALAEKLRSVIDGASILILTSPADRACESAEILGKAFGVECEIHEILWSDEIHREDFPGTLELLRGNRERADVLILVTHYEYVRDFPAYFSNHELGGRIESWLIEKGEAWVLDCEKKTLTHVA